MFQFLCFLINLGGKNGVLAGLFAIVCLQKLGFVRLCQELLRRFATPTKPQLLLHKAAAAIPNATRCKMRKKLFLNPDYAIDPSESELAKQIYCEKK